MSYAQTSAKDDFKQAIQAINTQNGNLALSWYGKGFAKLTNGEKIDESSLLEAKAGQATAYFLIGKTRQAENIIQPLLDDIKRVKGELSVDNIAAHYLLALSFQLSGQYRKATNYYERLVDLQEQIPNIQASQRVHVLKNQSSVYQQSGDYQQALLSEKKALKLVLSVTPVNHNQVITTYSRLVFLAELLGDSVSVLDYLQQQYTYQVSQFGDKHPESKRMLAWLDKTKDNYRNVLSGNDLNSLAGFNLNVYEVDQLGFPDQTEIFYNNVREQYGDIHPLSLKALIRLADSLSFSAQYERAIPLYNKAIKQHKDLFDEPGADRAGLYLRLSQAYEFASTYGVTEKYREKSISTAKKSVQLYEGLYGDVHLRTIIALNQLWKLTRFSNESNKDNFLLANRIWDAYTQLERSVLPYMNKQQRIGFRQNFSELKDNFLEAAWSLDRKLLSESAFETNKFWDTIVNHSTEIQQAKNWQEIKKLWDKQLIELEEASADDEKHRQQRMVVSQQVITRLYNQWMRYKGGLSALDNSLVIARAISNDKQQKQDIDRLIWLLKKQATSFIQERRDKNNLLQKEISQLTIKLSQDIPSLTLVGKLNASELIQSLDKNTVFIDFARYLNSEYMVFIIEPNGKIHIRRLTGGLEAGDKINKTILKLRSRIDDIIDGNIPYKGSEKKLLVSLQDLYDAIIVPIDDIINKYDTIISSPDGLLSLLPLNILRNKETGKYLIERYTIQTIPSSREWLRLKILSQNKSHTNAVTIYANPDFDSGSENTLTACASQHPNRSAREVLMKTFKHDCIPALPATADEAHAIARLIPDASVYEKQQANEKQFLQLSSPRILHLATHGFFIPDPAIINPLEKTGIILSGANTSLAQGKTEGIVTGLKLAGLNLSGTELVVLSACETGVGDIQAGEGVAGLNQAFIRAGAKGIVMSLWRVPDKATSNLMAGFYKAMSSGEKPAVALRNVQLQFIKQRKHPLSWAAFVFNG